MKSTGTMIALVTVLIATLVTVFPMTSGAANYAPAAYREPISLPTSGGQCSMNQEAVAADCAVPGADRIANAGILVLDTDRDYLAASEPNDVSGALLEDLVENDRSDL